MPISDEDAERKISALVKGLVRDTKISWYDDGERHAAKTAAKLLNKMAPDCVEPFCSYFACTRAWGEFEWARLGDEKPDWLNDPVE